MADRNHLLCCGITCGYDILINLYEAPIAYGAGKIQALEECRHVHLQELWE